MKQSGTTFLKRFDDVRMGGRHADELEIVTWNTPAGDELGEDLGWGACIIEEIQDLKNRFEVSSYMQITQHWKPIDFLFLQNEVNFDFATFHEYWPQGFRWTCCGLPGDYKWDCGHHFDGCRCDSCRYEALGSMSSVAKRDAKYFAQT